MYYSSPILLAKSNIEKLNFAKFPMSSVTGPHCGYQLILDGFGEDED